MRTLASAVNAWQEIITFQTLEEFSRAVRLGVHSSAASNGLRSVFWKVFLLFESIETTTWTKTLLSSRSAYNSLRLHFLRLLENESEVSPDESSFGEDSDRAAFYHDQELRAEIMQDVERCLPEIMYFRQASTQRLMLDILFIFCKLNPDIGYRQGMHELLAPILWVVEKDAIDLRESSKIMGEDAIITNILDAEYIEHDAFALFGQVMHSAKNFYEQTTHSGEENPIVRRSQNLFENLLPNVDKKLAQHMQDIEIMPQIFVIRWVRLLFGREFPFDDVLNMWDVIFAEDPSLEIVDYICVVMLLRIRFDLIEADYNMALTLLLRYPEVDKEQSPQAFVLDALYLRDHAGAEGGGYVVLKYTGRPLPPVGGSNTPPALQRRTTTFSGLHTSKAISPTRLLRQQRNIEAMLQSTAKNILARGERLGVGVRNAVDEVHKKAMEIRDAQQAGSSQQVSRRKGSQSSTEVLYNKVKGQELRSKQLSKLLASAVNELWDYQKLVSDGKSDAQDPEVVDKLSLAIARVQFVQVYLDDTTLPLPDDEMVTKVEAEGNSRSASSEKEVKAESKNSVSLDDPPKPIFAQQVTTSAGLADPGTFEYDYFETSKAATEQRVLEHTSNEHKVNATLTSDERKGQTTEQIPQHRPSLEQSPFSYMLGQKDTPPSSNSPLRAPPSLSSPFSQEKKKVGGEKSFLFGEDEQGTGEEIQKGTQPTVVTPSRKGRRQKHIVLTTESHDHVFEP
nr:tbc1 domain family member 5 [Quercus suber]